MSTRIKNLIALLIVIVPATALASDTKVIFSGSTHTTAVSGHSNTKSTVNDGNWFGLQGLTFWEEHDFACRIETNADHFNKESTRKREFSTRNGCNNSKKEVLFNGEDDYVYKIQVCTTDKKDASKNRFKGVRIWARTINRGSTITLTNQPTKLEAKRTNCKKWHPAVSCPAGQVANALKVHYDGSNITGLALDCRKVVKQ
ncbi:MAG: hypothetical protein VYE40_05795 [Myxococcota bacterium]|jgi:hypothetical protein|nr:hypothetical protein [Myxococcota bacterium]